MKVKILKFVPKDVVNTMTDLVPNQVLNLEDEVAQKLVEKGVAEYEL